MLMTEEEARKKWCPHVRFAATADESNAANRWNDANGNPPSCRCLASECMSWRWLWLDPNGPNVRLPEDCAAATTGEVHKRITNETYEPAGFCGLAGRPL
ncbi:hypothetical protein [Telmatospirillum sp.]|uniref:hypothetical protein n=1 Tax=Telmatospirillum sp. TaxID=2079197 RepID=UPI00283E73B5|nr:hypothetical protein [Telmatospirillum sp.]MDR3439848.1 hypothetical protein [Telmatospirillum sp.]